MYEKWKSRGFTLLELLTVLAITTMLIGLLVPSLTMVRTFAKNTKQKAQLASIGAALDTFRNDYGEYPPSDVTGVGYCGAQKLCEALLGQDLRGFNPNTGWIPSIAPGGVYSDATIGERKSRYLELATENAFMLGIYPNGLYSNNPSFSSGALWSGGYVLCDVFVGKKKVTLLNGESVGVGAPILYYRANVSSRILYPGPPSSPPPIYEPKDNWHLIFVKGVDDGKPSIILNETPFCDYIRDPKIPKVPSPWPVRPDSYLLITAGADGWYGTKDDICNFTPNFE
jgi:prepilin-type N-terminal cleavage/methylation domain-containing protein